MQVSTLRRTSSASSTSTKEKKKVRSQWKGWTKAQVQEVTLKFISNYEGFHGRFPKEEEVTAHIAMRTHYPPTAKAFWSQVWLLGWSTPRTLSLISSIKKIKEQFKAVVDLDTFLCNLGTFECTEQQVEEGAVWVHILHAGGESL